MNMKFSLKYWRVVEDKRAKRVSLMNISSNTAINTWKGEVLTHYMYNVSRHCGLFYMSSHSFWFVKLCIYVSNHLALWHVFTFPITWLCDMYLRFQSPDLVTCIYVSRNLHLWHYVTLLDTHGMKNKEPFGKSIHTKLIIVMKLIIMMMFVTCRSDLFCIAPQLFFLSICLLLHLKDVGQWVIFHLYPEASRFIGPGWIWKKV